MGCDGFIVDPDTPVRFGMRCYVCGVRIIEGETVSAYHKGCLDMRDDDHWQLRVNLDLENYVER